MIELPETKDVRAVAARVDDMERVITSLQAVENVGRGLRGVLLLNTGPFIASPEQHIVHWREPNGQTIRIKKTLTWFGVDLDHTVDILGYIIRASDYSYVSPFPLDRYGNPTGPNLFLFDYGHDYAELKPDDKLLLIYQAVPVGNSGGQTFHAHVAMWAWY